MLNTARSCRIKIFCLHTSVLNALYMIETLSDKCTKHLKGKHLYLSSYTSFGAKQTSVLKPKVRLGFYTDSEATHNDPEIPFRLNFTNCLFLTYLF